MYLRQHYRQKFFPNDTTSLRATLCHLLIRIIFSKGATAGPRGQILFGCWHRQATSTQCSYELLQLLLNAFSIFEMMSRKTIVSLLHVLVGRLCERIVPIEVKSTKFYTIIDFYMLINIRYWAMREINANGKKLKFLRPTFDYKIVIASKNVNFQVHV